MIRNMQDSLVLETILKLKKLREFMFTGEIYEEYLKMCNEKNIQPLSKDNVSARLNYFGEYEVIDVDIVSRGRYGRSKVVELKIPDIALQMMIEERINKQFVG